MSLKMITGKGNEYYGPKCYIQMVVKSYSQQLRMYKYEFRHLPAGFLIRREKDGRVYFYHAMPVSEQADSQKYVNRGITRRPDLVQKLARKAFLKTAITAMERRINVLKEAAAKMPEDGFEEDPTNLSAVIRDLDKSLYRSCGQLEMQQSENPQYRENLCIATNSGVFVRSYGERIIADLLFEYGIHFYYEKTLVIGGLTYYPDFMIIHPLTGKIYYLEHKGNVTDHDNMRKFDRKIYFFRRHGIVPWDNFLITYARPDNSLNINYLRHMITAIFLDPVEAVL
ncbi:MAG: hypothetical protein LKJ83_03910 [Eubacteriaceae bacterium]|nr:hypothetical protein [Eubacteriaceae bacterium]